MVEVKTFLNVLIFIIILSLNQVENGAILQSLGNSIKKSLTTNFSNKAVDFNITQLITAYGYVSEEHEVQTLDGYILLLERIPNTGPAVFLMHGVLNSADDYFTLGPNKALGFLLADAGYDVWIGNSRGNKYCRKHIKFSPTERAFWDFSFHEIGVYDLPAMIDYALEKSNRSQLTYIGHSQGTTVFFVMASELPEYNSKVSLMVSMATVAWLYHARTPVFDILVPLRNLAYIIKDTLHIYDILPYDPFWRFITGKLCQSSRFAQDVCAAVVFSVYGFNYGQLNYTQFPIFFGHLPGGASFTQLVHFGQLIDSRKFQQFDFNSTELNVKAYDMKSPPQYAVEKITAPIFVMYGVNDLISSLQDVEILVGKLPNVKEMHRIDNIAFNHMDFLWATNAKPLVYTKILQWIGNFNV